MNLTTTSLFPFTNLSKEEKLMILEWRNNTSVRKWMHTNYIISENDHFLFIEKLKYDDTKLYFLVVTKQPIGVIYFTNIDRKKNQAEFGLYANPNSKRQGNTLMRMIFEHGFKSLGSKRLYAEVFSDNEKALSLYQKFGCQQYDEKILYKRKILCMELMNENR